MTKENFIRLINAAVAYRDELERWYDFGIDLFELPLGEVGWTIFNASLDGSFTKEGIDWINWWLFEKFSESGDSLQAYDENNRLIQTETVDDLWELIKEYLR